MFLGQPFLSISRSRSEAIKPGYVFYHVKAHKTEVCLISNFPPSDLNFNFQISSKSTVKSPKIYREVHTVWSMASSNILCHYVLGAFVCCDKRNRNYTSAPASLDMTYRYSFNRDFLADFDGKISKNRQNLKFKYMYFMEHAR